MLLVYTLNCLLPKRLRLSDIAIALRLERALQTPNRTLLRDLRGVHLPNDHTVQAALEQIADVVENVVKRTEA